MELDRSIDVTSDQRETLLALLKKHLPNTAAWVYGSRAKWTARPQSDLDLVVFTKPDQERCVSDLREAFEGSNLPFRVDLFIWEAIPEQFQKRIETEHVVLVGHEWKSDYKTSGHIPDGWERYRFLDLCDVTRGASPRPIHDWIAISGMPWVKIADASADASRHINQTREFIRPEGRSKSVIVFPGDLILSNSASPGIPKFMGTEACIHDGWLLLRNFRGLDKLFAYYLLLHERDALVNKGTGSVFTNLKTETIKQHEVAIPPLSEQRAIAHILGTLDDKIELNRRINETLEAMARAIFKDWFVDFGPVRAKMKGRKPYLAPEIWDLFPNALSDGDKPVGWKICRLEDCLELAYGKSLPQKQRKSGPVAVYGSGGLTGRHDTALIGGPAVIVGRKGTVGSLYWEDDPVFPIDTVFYVVPRISSLLFSYHLLASQPLRDMNTDAAVPGLNRSNAYRLEFPNPGVEIISAFDEVTESIWKRRSRNLKETKDLIQVRDLLLPKLVPGKVRIKNIQ